MSCCAAGFTDRAPARPCQLGNVPTPVEKWHWKRETMIALIRMKERYEWKRRTCWAVAPSSFLASTAAMDGVEDFVGKSPRLGKKIGPVLKTGPIGKQIMKTLTAIMPSTSYAESGACSLQTAAATTRPRLSLWVRA